jgi:predicted protein tyrosine phosphatase
MDIRPQEDGKHELRAPAKVCMHAEDAVNAAIIHVMEQRHQLPIPRSSNRKT